MQYRPAHNPSADVSAYRHERQAPLLDSDSNGYLPFLSHTDD